MPNTSVDYEEGWNQGWVDAHDGVHCRFQENHSDFAIGYKKGYEYKLSLIQKVDNQDRFDGTDILLIALAIAFLCLSLIMVFVPDKKEQAPYISMVAFGFCFVYGLCLFKKVTS
jgi:hypothetical protein